MSTTTTTATSAGPPPPSSLEAKVVVLGSQNVGKTSLVHRYVHSSFLPSHMTPSTVGASFLTTRVHDPETDTVMRLQIWDTAGQERFRSISKLYYRGAHAAVLCYDITSRRSFDEMGAWLRELKEMRPTSDDQATILHIVGTKSDIVAADPSKREVPFERCIDFVAHELFPPSSPPPLPPSKSSRPGSSHAATTLKTSSSPPAVHFWNAGAPDQVWDCCHEISAKDGEGIDEVFRVITRKLIEQHAARQDAHHRALDATGGRTPAWPGSSATPADAGYFDGRHGAAAGLLTPGGMNAGGSFRLGHGDRRRSWLGLGGGGGGPSSMSTTPGYSGLSDDEEARLRALEERQGRCCT